MCHFWYVLDRAYLKEIYDRDVSKFTNRTGEIYGDYICHSPYYALPTYLKHMAENGLTCTNIRHPITIGEKTGIKSGLGDQTTFNQALRACYADEASDWTGYRVFLETYLDYANTLDVTSPHMPPLLTETTKLQLDRRVQLAFLIFTLMDRDSKDTNKRFTLNSERLEQSCVEIFSQSYDTVRSVIIHHSDEKKVAIPPSGL